MPGAMTSVGQRRVARGLRILVLVAPLGLALGWLWSRPEQASSPFDRALDTRLVPVLQHTEAAHKLGATTPAQARLLARELARRSVAYLDADDLEQWAAIRLRAARASKPVCAGLWRGGDDTSWGRAVAALGPEALDAWVALLARALARGLERKPTPAVAPAALEGSLAAVAEQLAGSERERFEADARRRDVSDERACELFLTLASGAEKLTPAARVDLYRALAAAPPVTPH